MKRVLSFLIVMCAVICVPILAYDGIKLKKKSQASRAKSRTSAPAILTPQDAYRCSYSTPGWTYTLSYLAGQYPTVAGNIDLTCSSSQMSQPCQACKYWALYSVTYVGGYPSMTLVWSLTGAAGNACGTEGRYGMSQTLTDGQWVFLTSLTSCGTNIDGTTNCRKQGNFVISRNAINLTVVNGRFTSAQSIHDAEVITDF